MQFFNMIVATATMLLSLAFAFPAHQAGELVTSLQARDGSPTVISSGCNGSGDEKWDDLGVPDAITALIKMQCDNYFNAITVVAGSVVRASQSSPFLCLCCRAIGDPLCGL